jgi:hypothetical protein
MIYFVEVERTGEIKVGFSTDVEKRIKSLSTASPYPLRLLIAVPGSFAEEKLIHYAFSSERLNGEWFRGDGRLRAFALRIASMSHEQALTEISSLAVAIKQVNASAASADEESEEEIAESIAYSDRLVNACKSAIETLGLEYCSAELTACWGPQGRPVSVKCLRGVLAGKFNVRLEWVYWLRSVSTVVDAAVVAMADRCMAKHAERARLRAECAAAS